MFQLFGFAIFVGVVLPIVLGVLIFIWCSLKLIDWVQAPEKKLREENAKLKTEIEQLQQELAKQHKVATAGWVEYD